MLHHLSLGVRDLTLSIRFYDAVLAELGLVRVWSDLRPGEAGQGVGYGPVGADDLLALKQRDEACASPGFHLALAAGSHAAVKRFHARALACGGADAGVPGLRPQYGARYYAAFVTDPDGHRLEAVCLGP
ncbi:MAG: VOC family protein [Xanthomonadales bacterium]|nr:VOC family protein [Xanthomonadales bacterium]MCB1633906.1 VOC family protein [Xanthomonadales bacterium]MCB1642942.1 VOC family protein [Xanthomonadales bacterium]